MNSLQKNRVQVYISIGLLAIGAFSFNNYRNEQRIKNERIAVLQQQKNEYEVKLATCLNTREVFPFTYQNNPRSRERLESVSNLFFKIVSAPCLEKNDNKMYKNPYLGIDLGKINQNAVDENEVEIFEGFLYEFDKGVPFLRSGMTLCEDGSLSYSRGSGTCSWHGGYARQRGEPFTFSKATLETDPRVELETLTSG
jgi:hypothetical protein